MKIREIVNDNQKHMSFEVFPPKKEDQFEKVLQSTEKVAALNPSFVSVTYGAGGGTSKYTLDIVTDIMKKYELPTMAHLTCVSSSKETIIERINDLKAAGVENVMALRGDLTPELMETDRSKWDFRYAVELVRLLRETDYDFCIGCGCYPEVHPESPSPEEDLIHLKEKVDAGCDFLTTQMFFENSIYYSFVDKCLQNGINVPVLPGILPITKAVQVKRSIELSGSYVPKELLDLSIKYAEDNDSMKQAGIEFAMKQIRDLYDNGVKNVHVYTMNLPSVAKAIKDGFFE